MQDDFDPTTDSIEDWLSEHNIGCPYCGETIGIVVDHDNLPASYIEDCQVCCQPINLHIVSDQEGDLHIDARRDDD
ncbi:MAG: CPXCG motif-containing cysteine-rich protein [Gammaproteobacteria bacterium]|nr:CPXCG motif-containing cysteine-rich protein [Gammaproteobacteria bacterium]